MNQNTFKTVLCVAFALVAFFATAADTEAQIVRQRRFSLGLYGAYGLDFHNVNFLDLPNAPVFTPRTGGSNEPAAFSNTTTWNPAFGVVLEYLIDERLSVGLRGGYATQNTRLTTRSTYRVGRSDGTFDNATSEYAISDTVGMISLEPMVSYNLWEGLSVHVGVRLNFVNSPKYYQAETLLSPSDGSFFPIPTGGSPVTRRNISAGDLPNANTFTIAPFAGISYAIPIIDRLTVHPEVFYSLGITPVVKDLQWSVNSLRPGLSVKYKF